MNVYCMFWSKAFLCRFVITLCTLLLYHWWVKNLLTIFICNLSEDVKSLALPGTYHEKVVSLGSSLRKFSRLKHLDLSRNNISSLQGLEHLKLLEKLNLYPCCLFLKFSWSYYWFCHQTVQSPNWLIQVLCFLIDILV